MRIESKWTSDIIGDYETLFLEMPLSQCEVREQHIFHYILHFQHFFTQRQINNLETVRLRPNQQSYFPSASDMCYFLNWYQYMRYYDAYEPCEFASVEEFVVQSHDNEHFGTPNHDTYYRYYWDKVEEYSLFQYDRLIHKMPVYMSYMTRALTRLQNKGSFSLWRDLPNESQKVSLNSKIG